MVLRPGQQGPHNHGVQRAGEVHTPFSCRLALPRTIEVQGTTAGHLARAVAGERSHGAAGAAPLVERARQTASTRARANDRNSEPAQADGRFKQAITSRSRQGPPCLVMRPSQDGWGAVMSLRRARRWRWGLLPGPDSLPGCSRRWSHRPARPGRAPRSRPWGRSAADVPKRWALTPASFAAPGRCSRAFPIQPRRD
jgi:hypothetical protein